MSTPEECVTLDIPEGLRLNLLGLIVEIGRIRIVADAPVCSAESWRP